ncbi:MAG: ferrous iron transport protein A [Eubacteriales bacterium]
MNCSLYDIKPGEKAVVSSLSECGAMRRRLLDIGLVENTRVECVGTSPGGGLCAYLIRGAVIALRPEDSRKIITK